MLITRQDLYKPLNVQAIIRGTIISFIISLILILASAIMTFYINQISGWVDGLSIAIYLISCLLGGAISAKLAGHKGLWHGIFTGVFICLVALLFSLLFIPGHLVFSYIIKKFLISLIAGALGGIIGVAFN